MAARESLCSHAATFTCPVLATTLAGLAAVITLRTRGRRISGNEPQTGAAAVSRRSRTEGSSAKGGLAHETLVWASTPAKSRAAPMAASRTAAPRRSSARRAIPSRRGHGRRLPAGRGSSGGSGRGLCFRLCCRPLLIAASRVLTVGRRRRLPRARSRSGHVSLGAGPWRRPACQSAAGTKCRLRSLSLSPLSQTLVALRRRATALRVGTRPLLHRPVFDFVVCFSAADAVVRVGRLVKEVGVPAGLAVHWH